MVEKSVIESIATESTLYEEVIVNKDTKVDIMVAGSNGIFIFISPKEKEEYKRTIRDIKDKYGLYQSAVFIFINDNDEYSLVEKDEKELIPVDDVYQAFENVYKNTQRPYVDYTYIQFNENKKLLSDIETIDEELGEKEAEYTGDLKYVRKLVPDVTLSRIDNVNDSLRESDKYSNKKTKINEDGTVYVQKYDCIKIIGWAKGTSWYRCSDVDPDKIFISTLLGGWFGLHKFREGRIPSGILYLISCGGFGVFYIFDLVKMLFGNYSYNEITYYEDESGELKRFKEKVYYQAPQKRWLKSLCIILSIAFAFILLNTAYKALYEVISDLICHLATNIETDPESAQRKLDVIQNIVR